MPGLLKQYSTFVDVLSRLADPTIVIIVTILFDYFNPATFAPPLLKGILIWCSIFTVLIFPLCGLYRSWRGTKLWNEIRIATIAWFLVVLSFNLLILLIAAPQQRKLLLPFCLFSFKPFFIWLLLCWATIITFRISTRILFRLLRKKGRNTRTAIIFGAGDLGIKVKKMLTSNSWVGIRTVAFFDDNPNLHGEAISRIKVLGNLDKGINYIKENRPDIIFITLPFRSENRIKKIISELKDCASTCYLVPDLFNLELFSMSLLEIANIPLLDLNYTRLNTPAARIVKVTEDILLSIIILAVISPILLIIGLLVKVTSNGPIIFRQRRYGIHGNEIIVYKFRTMSVCEDGELIPQAKCNDDRTTTIGKFLRRTSLDELPQFINVLQGRMSIVGPRPHAVAHNEIYRKLISGYMLRHKVKPGITGWAQINGWRGETDTIEKMKCRVEHDHYYIRNWSIWLDLKIIFTSTLIGFSSKNSY